MGCAPSIHVSQRTGVVYCQDDIKETSRSSGLQPAHVSKRLSAASLSISEVVSHIPSGHRESLTTEVRITHFQTGGKRDSLITTTTTTTTQAWVSADGKQTQTDILIQGMDKVCCCYNNTVVPYQP
jgi:PDE8 phosphodiesterase.